MRNGPGHTSTKKVMVPWVVRNGPNSYLNVDTNPFIDPVDRSRSISTVDKDSPTREYGRYRRSIRIHLQRITVDRRWWIKIRDNLAVDEIDHLVQLTIDHLEPCAIDGVKKDFLFLDERFPAVLPIWCLTSPLRVSKETSRHFHTKWVEADFSYGVF